METAESQHVNNPVYEFSGERLLSGKNSTYLNKLTVVDCRGYCSSDMSPLILIKSRVMVTLPCGYVLYAAFNERIRGRSERASIS